MNVFDDGKMYFATSYRKDEMECLRQVQPPNLLLSFAMWRTKQKDKDIQKEFMNQLNYRPKSILIDSGAYTFRDEEIGLEEILEIYTEMKEEDGIEFDPNDEIDFAMFAHWCFGEFEEDFYKEDKNSFSLFGQYLNFLFWNNRLYDYCFAFDKFGNNEESLLSYRVMRALGLPVIPVYQAVDWGATPGLNTRELDILDYYAETSDYIAIGGTAIRTIKGFTKKIRIDIIRTILDRYPDKKFHLLGTLDPQIVEVCPELYSFDGQCWVQKVKKEKKIEASCRYLEDKIQWFEGHKTPQQIAI